MIVDLVVNHTSDQHPWFQAARRDAGSRYRDYYVWTREPARPSPPARGTIFPGQESSVWTWDEVAARVLLPPLLPLRARAEDRQPARSSDEIYRIMDFWLVLRRGRLPGGRRVAHDRGEGRRSNPPAPPTRTGSLRPCGPSSAAAARARSSSASPTCASARSPTTSATGDELNLLFNFLLDNYLFLALARERAEPIVRVLNLLPSIPHGGAVGELPPQPRRAGPGAAHGRGARGGLRGLRARGRTCGSTGAASAAASPRCSAGDRRRLEMAYSLLFSLPGSPVLVYGDEIGMGEDLSLEGRNAVRTPMQWSAEAERRLLVGARGDALRSPVVDEGAFSYSAGERRGAAGGPRLAARLDAEADLARGASAPSSAGVRGG